MTLTPQPLLYFPMDVHHFICVDLAQRVQKPENIGFLTFLNNLFMSFRLPNEATKVHLLAFLGVTEHSAGHHR